MDRTSSDFSFNYDESKREEMYRILCDFLGRIQHLQFEQRELKEVLKEKEECKEEMKDLETMIEARKVFIQQLNELAKIISPKVTLSGKESSLLQWVLEKNVEDIPEEYFNISGTKDDNDTASSGRLSMQQNPTIVPNVPTIVPSPPEEQQPRSKSLFEHVTDCLCCRLRHERYR